MNPGLSERSRAAESFSYTGAFPAALFRHRPRLDPDAPAIENVAKVIGAGAAARLIARFGGRRMYIAKRPAAGDALARLVGYEAAVKLGAIFGGERMWLPNGAGHATRTRVAQLRRAGASVSRIAGELGLSERHVYKVLAQLRAR